MQQSLLQNKTTLRSTLKQSRTLELRLAARISKVIVRILEVSSGRFTVFSLAGRSLDKRYKLPMGIARTHTHIKKVCQT
eukprot:31678-Amphidinium_carterae.1